VDPDTMRFLAPRLALRNVTESRRQHGLRRSATALTLSRRLLAALLDLLRPHEGQPRVEQRATPSHPQLFS
jgi:hypothetical protein